MIKQPKYRKQWIEDRKTSLLTVSPYTLYPFISISQMTAWTSRFEPTHAVQYFIIGFVVFVVQIIFVFF